MVSYELACSFSGLSHAVIPCAGVPQVTLDTVKQLPGVTLHNIHHNIAAASEMAISLMLAAVKRLIHSYSALRKGAWSPGTFRQESLSRTAG